MKRNIICLGDWISFESRTRHVMLRTAVSSRFDGDGKRFNTLCNRALTAAGEFLPLPANSILLIALEPGRREWDAVRAFDSLLVEVPTDLVPLTLEGEAELLEFLIRQIVLFYGPAPGDGKAAELLDASSHFLAVERVKESGARDSRWFNAMAGNYLAALQSPGPLYQEAKGFAAAFFLDQALRRLADSDRSLGGFFAQLGEEAGGSHGEKTFNELMAALSDYAGFDVLPFWKRYLTFAGGHGVENELMRCGLVLKRAREGHTLAKMK